MEPATCPCTGLSACWRPHFAGVHVNASRKLGIGCCFAALLASSAGAQTRVYGAVASNYVFRGVSWSDERASASAGLDWQHPLGVYAGGSVTTLDQGVELDGYAGYTHQIGAFSIDFGGTLYDYSDDDYIDGDFRELYVGGQFGPVAVSVYRGRSPFDNARYWYGEANAGFPAGPVTIELHYGLSDYGFGENIDDAYAGIAAGWRGFDWRVRFTHREDDVDDVNVVLAISRSWRVSR
jgi:uncharacterized protein (TIGR02001 family)